MILAIIPARAGSKTVPNKNIKLMDGKPLIEYTINAVKKSSLKHSYLISTDSSVIKARYLNSIDRPKELAGDDSKVIETIKHAIKHAENNSPYKVEHIVLLQPTSPIRTEHDINNALLTYFMSYRKCLYSGTYISIKETGIPFDKKTSKKHFQRNGSIFITSRELIDKDLIWDEDPYLYEMPKYKSIDIDDEEDFYITESILKNRSIYVQGDC